MIKTVTYPIREIKAPDSKGSFTAYIAETWPEDTAKRNADSDGDIFVTGAFDAQDGDKVPVFYQHDYAPTSEVGEATLHPGESRDVLPATGQLFVGQGKPIAEAVYESMLLPSDNPSALKEFSVGYEYDTKDVTTRPDGVRVIRKSRVVEVSVVYQGAQRTELVSVKHQNAASYLQSAHDALVKAGAKCAGEDKSPVTIVVNNPTSTGVLVPEPDETKTAIGSHSTDTYSASWDGPATEASIPNDAGASVFRKMFAWVDPQGDPDVKASYRFLHHSYSGGPGPANTTACSTGIGVLNGGRGGTTIPDADVQGVYNHLAKHLRDAELEPPPLKSDDEPNAFDEIRRKLTAMTALIDA